MAAKEIRIHSRRFEVYDWSERLAADGRLHACGKPICGTFKVTLPRTVGISATVEMEAWGDGTSAIVDDVTPEPSGEYLVRGSLLR